MKFAGLAITVGLVSIVQMYLAGPIGLAGGLDRGSIIVAMWIGGMIGVVAFVYWGPRLVAFVSRLSRRVLRRAEPEEEDTEKEKEGRITELAKRFGAPFLGIVGPLTIGGWAAAVLGVSLGMSKGKLIFWLGVGQAIVIVGYVWALEAVSG